MQEKKIRPVIEKTTETFDPIQYLNNSKYPLIEIGGPTPPSYGSNDQYLIIDITKITKRIYPLNLTRTVDVHEPLEETGEYVVTSQWPAKLRADGTQLPLPNEQISGVFASAMEIPLRERIIAEAARVLEPGGLLIWQTGEVRDKEIALTRGFKVIKHQVSKSLNHDYIFQKI